jgi:pimeloyl-ACP methyl ester carboxylesterase
VRAIETNGVTLAVEDRGEGYPIVLIHGFPETSYSWRHVAPVLHDAGFRVITYDLRGSGASSGPDAIDAYGLVTQTEDLVGILDRIGIDEAAIVGHDWGSIIGYAAALGHPARISHVVSLNVPYLGWPSGFPSIESIRERFSDRLGYVLGFQEPGKAESHFMADPHAWLRRMYGSVAASSDFMTPEELDVYSNSFVASGLAGLLNLYRNIDRNIIDYSDLAGHPLAQPCLLVTVDKDPVLPAELAEPMHGFAADLEIAHIPNCGHWTQQEQPDLLNGVLVEWLGRRLPA